MTIDLRGKLIEYLPETFFNSGHITTWSIDNELIDLFSQLLNPNGLPFVEEFTDYDIVVKTSRIEQYRDKYRSDVKFISEQEYWKSMLETLFPNRVPDVYYKVEPIPSFAKSEDCNMAFHCVHDDKGTIEFLIKEGHYGSTDPWNFIIKEIQPDLKNGLIAWFFQNDDYSCWKMISPMCFNSQEDFEEYTDWQGHHYQAIFTQQLTNAQDE